MGIALALEFALRGFKVFLIKGPNTPAVNHSQISITEVQTASEMYNECINIFPSCGIALMAAAVADYRPAQISLQKIKKQEQDDIMTLQLIKNKDILAELGKLKSDNQVLGGFSLETHNELAFAREKMLRKNCDFIVMNSLNDEGAGFGTDTNKVSILTADKVLEYKLKPKTEVATDIVEFILNQYFGNKIA